MNVVTIILNKTKSKDFYDLRCIKCGRKMCNVNREAEAVIIDGIDGSDVINAVDNALVEIKCRGCNSIYNILIQ